MWIGVSSDYHSGMQRIFNIILTGLAICHMFKFKGVFNIRPSGLFKTSGTWNYNLFFCDVFSGRREPHKARLIPVI